MNKKTVATHVRRILTGTLIGLPLLFLLIPVTVGLMLTHPRSRKTPKTPRAYGMDFESISFPSTHDGVSLSGWWIPSFEPSTRTIITAHGYRNERSQSKIELLNLVREFHQQGYNVLMFDFRNSGVSKGRQTSIGFYEQHDLNAAIHYAVTNRSQTSIALLGFSMGAATALMVGSQHDAVKAIVADSPFSDLEPYLKDNLAVWSKLPNKPFTPMILFSMERLLRFRSKEVSPLRSVQTQNDKAYLLIHSKHDTSIPFTHSKLLFDELHTTNRKELWLTEEADHVRSYQHHPDEYAKRVLTFLSETL